MKITKLLIGACIMACTSTVVLADGMVFEPVEMPAANTTKAPVTITTPAPQTATPVNATTTTPAAVQEQPQTSFFDKFNSDSKVADMSLKENQKMQSALTDLDCSQVELRQNLQKLQTNYSSVDKNYVKYKAERAALKKQINTANKKLKKLESVKKTIRKNML